MAGTLTATKSQHRPRGVVRATATFTTDASGVVTATSIGSFFGRLVGLIYNAGDMDTGADILIKDVATGVTLWTGTDLGTSDLLIRPMMVPTGTLTKTALTPAAGYVGNAELYVAGEISVEVAQGGNAKSGSLVLIIDEGSRSSASLGG